MLILLTYSDNVCCVALSVLAEKNVKLLHSNRCKSLYRLDVQGCRFSIIFPFFHYFWPDPFSADPFPVFRFFVNNNILFVNYLYVNILYFLLFHLSLSELSVSFCVHFLLFSQKSSGIDFQLFSQKSSGIPGCKMKLVLLWMVVVNWMLVFFQFCFWPYFDCRYFFHTLNNFSKYTSE